MSDSSAQAIVRVENLKTVLGGHTIHEDLSLSIRRGEIFAIVGGSGSGKTTLMREIIMLLKPTAGRIWLFDEEITDPNYTHQALLKRRLGVMFQQGALFSSLTVLENVLFPLREFTRLSKKVLREMAMLKIQLVGLSPEAAFKYPAELSGGMIKRASIARALAMDPELLFLDEPTAGLDPQGAGALDELVLDLQSALGLTVVMVTHDLDTLYKAVDRIAFLGEGRLLGLGSIPELCGLDESLIQDYFKGPRARLLQQPEGI